MGDLPGSPGAASTFAFFFSFFFSFFLLVSPRLPPARRARSPGVRGTPDSRPTPAGRSPETLDSRLPGPSTPAARSPDSRATPAKHVDASSDGKEKPKENETQAPARKTYKQTKKKKKKKPGGPAGGVGHGETLDPSEHFKKKKKKNKKKTKQKQTFSN